MLIQLYSDDAPVTKRQQFLLSSLRSTGSSRAEVGAFPQVANVSADIQFSRHPDKQQLHKQGLQIMHDVYQTSLSGLNQLAKEDPALLQRLSTLPTAMHLVHDMHSLEPQANFNSSYANHMQITATAGMLLFQQTPQQLAFIMNHELGHGIAEHSAEMKSWSVLIAFIAFVRLHWSGMGALAALLTTGAIWACTEPLIVGVWLSQLLEFEADEIGVAISKKAGCSPADITTAMAAICVREASFRQGAWAGCKTDTRIHTSLMALQQLLPNSQLPMQPVQDSRGLQLVLDAVTDELSIQTDIVCALVDEELKCLRRLIALQML